MSKLLKHISVILCMVSFGAAAFGQRIRPYIPTYRHPPVIQPQDRYQRVPPPVRRIQVVRENFMSRQLNLTPEQAQKFWPLYRRYQDALTAVRKAKRLNNSNSQPDGTDQINKELYYETELVNIRKYYNEEFLKILPPEKVSEIYKSEREFTDELIKQLQERSGPVKNNP